MECLCNGSGNISNFRMMIWIFINNFYIFVKNKEQYKNTQPYTLYIIYGNIVQVLKFNLFI